jgi:hypothetical protein
MATRCPRSASSAARMRATVVFPAPPLVFANVIVAIANLKVEKWVSSCCEGALFWLFLMMDVRRDDVSHSRMKLA